MIGPGDFRSANLPSQLRNPPAANNSSDDRLTIAILKRHNPSSDIFEVIMLAYLFVLFAVASRLPFFPHPWNFTPVVAALLFFGARGSRRQMWMPLALLIASDLILDKYVYAYPFSWDLFLTWGWYAAILGLGTLLRPNSKPLRIAGAALTGSVTFFLISNFGVWASTNMYPKSFSGLMVCYTAGIPFFRRALEGDMLYTAVMFGLPVIVAAIARSMSKPHGTAAA